MSKRLVPEKLLPPGVHDERQKAFVEAIDVGLSQIDLEAILTTNPQRVDARLLPMMVREFSCEEFVTADMSVQAVRNLLSRAWEIHERKGHVEGARLALEALGARVSWTQWWQEEPKAAHNTHKVSVFFGEIVIEGAALGDHLHRNAVTRIINATKRWSQSIAVTFGVVTEAVQFVGAYANHGARYTAGLPADDLPAPDVPVFTGAAAITSATYQGGLS